MGKGMRAGKKNSANKGAKNSQMQQMQQLQALQSQMQQLQDEIEAKEITTTAGGGAVEIVISGKKELKSIKLKPEIVDSDDIEMLQDLIVAAVNEGIRQVEEMSENEMGKLTGGLGIPGL